ncbi:Uncharacterized conserved protein, LabA/DUF88 family [Massilia sp. PDC64]|nr:Uncharacterized conserved protein, LabA/DUF88 family [Massilia sp. PDC64]
MAVFCDFENVALGVRDANYEKFDIKPVLERLLLKGSIVVKKSYCDWDRYKGFKATMHEANFELIEIPHVRQSGKNSADIRMVVDALDLCYTKSHVNTFVIVSGDSDFSPLVSKLRENAKRVIGVGVKQSTSDLLVANCDEFIFYDDLVREQRRAAAKRDERKAQPQGRRPSDENNRKREEMEARKLQALEMVVETFDALVSERGDTGKIWASLLKDTLKRRRPDFSETYYGFRTFGNLLEEAQTRGLFEFGRDEKSGTYVFRGANAQVDLQPVEAAPAEPAVEQPQVAAEPAPLVAVDELAAETQGEQPTEVPPAARESRRRGGRGRKSREAQAPAPAPEAAQEAAPESEDAAMATWPAPTPDLAEAPEPVVAAEEPVAAAEEPPAAPVKERRRATRTPRKPAARKEAAAAETPGTAVAEEAVAQEDSAVAQDAQNAVAEAAPAEPAATEGEGEAQGAKGARKKSARPAHKAPSRKPATRAPRRPAKAKTPTENS